MTISESTSDSFNDRIIRKYLYADENASNYASDQFIGRTSGQMDSIPVEDYMLYGPGRFAQPIFFELIQRFFNLNVDILLGRAQNFTIDQALEFRGQYT